MTKTASTCDQGIVQFLPSTNYNTGGQKKLLKSFNNDTDTKRRRLCESAPAFVEKATGNAQNLVFNNDSPKFVIFPQYHMVNNSFGNTHRETSNDPTISIDVKKAYVVAASASTPESVTNLKNDDQMCNITIRNVREQKRTQSINSKIDELRQLLVESGIEFEKKDKYSTLQTVEHFILSKQIQVQNLPPTPTPVTVNKKSNTLKSSLPVVSHEQLSYSNIFQNNPIPTAEMSLNGELLNVNKEFERIIGCPREHLLASRPGPDSKSIFHIFDTPETVKLVCEAMSELIQNTDDDEGYNKFGLDSKKRYWRGNVCCNTYPDVNLNITLILIKSNDTGAPLFFECILLKN